MTDLCEGCSMGVHSECMGGRCPCGRCEERDHDISLQNTEREQEVN